MRKDIHKAKERQTACQWGGRVSSLEINGRKPFRKVDFTRYNSGSFEGCR